MNDIIDFKDLNKYMLLFWNLPLSDFLYTQEKRAGILYPVL